MEELLYLANKNKTVILFLLCLLFESYVSRSVIIVVRVAADFIQMQIVPSTLKLIAHFTVVCLVIRPLSGSEVEVDIVLIPTSLTFI